MDYEKKYKEALERAKDMLAYKEVRQEDMEYLFPELEDERIRKAIKKALQVRCDGSRIISDEPVTLEEAIAWLEKQGGQMTKPKFKVGDRVVINCREEFATTYNGKEGTIINIFDLEKNHWGNIVVVLDNGMRNTFYTSELIKK